MNVIELLHTVLAVGWCTLLFAAIYGWGALGLRLAGVRHKDAALNVAAGFAWTIFVGGLLNAAQLITRSTALMFAGVGLALCAWELWNRFRFRKQDGVRALSLRWPVVLLLLAAGFVLSVRLLAAANDIYYQNQDDYGYYLAAPEKVMATHYFGADPFSERRAISTVGGGLYLNSLVLAELPLERMPMTDRVFGLLFICCLAFSLWEEFELSAVQGAALTLFLVAATQIQINITYVMLPAACFFALPLLAGTRKLAGKPWVRAVLLGAMAAVVTSTKSSYIVPAVCFLPLAAFALFRREGSRAGWRLLMGSCVGFGVVLAPWMIMNRIYAATFFYPLLGHGFHYSAYHQFGSASFQWEPILTKVLPFALPVVVIAVAELLLVSTGIGEFAGLLTVAAAVATIVVGSGTGGDSMRRYNYPYIVPAFLLAYPVLCVRARQALQRSGRSAKWLSFSLQATGIVLSTAVVLYVGYNNWTHEFDEQIAEAEASVQKHDPFELDAETYREYAAVNAALSPHGTALATVHFSFLLDFQHHDILLADWPGAAGPPEGWPVHGSGGDLAAYLHRYNVRYLIYSYKDEGASPDAWAHIIVANPAKSQWLKDESTAILNAHRQYAELATSRAHIFDDGQIYVLDLDCPLASLHCPA